MAQEEILNFLKENKLKKYSARELILILSLKRNTFYQNIDTLIKSNLINFKSDFNEKGTPITLYHFKDAKIREDMDREIGVLQKEIEIQFNKIFFKIRLLEGKSGELLESLKDLNNEREKIRISYFKDFENYHAKGKIIKSIKKLKYNIRKLKVEQW